MALTPVLTATPSAPPTYNVGMAETFSWIPVEGANRPLYARATYLANAEDIKVSLSAGDININLDEIELNTDNVEELLQETNTNLSAIQTDLNFEFNETQTLLDSLTALQDSKQSEIITLLHQLTANTDVIEIDTQDVETLLDSLTALQSISQEKIITLLNQLTANTDSVEGLIANSNTRLDVLTAIDYSTSAKQDVSNTLLDQLTSIQNSTQSEIITLLHSITGSALQVDLNTDQLELNVDDVETLLNDLTASNKAVPGFSIPPYDEIGFEYVGTTDIFRKVIYKNNSTQVMALSFVYVTEPPTTENAIIQTVKKI